MKFLWVILAYLLICVVLGWGILEAVKGSYWVLVVGFLAYLIAFGKLGCQTLVGGEGKEKTAALRVVAGRERRAGKEQQQTCNDPPRTHPPPHYLPMETGVIVGVWRADARARRRVTDN